MKPKTIWIFNIGLILLIILNIRLINSAGLGAISAALFLFFNSRLLAGYFQAKHQPLLASPAISLLIMICGLSIVSAIIYYFYKLDDAAIIVLLLLSASAPTVLNLSLNKTLRFKLPALRPLTRNTSLTVLYLSTVFVCLIILFNRQTDLPIASTWENVPWFFWLMYLIASALLILRLYYEKQAHTLAWLISIHVFLSSSIALIIYRLGFGYDPFVHQATEQAIYDNGQILPKPLYYLAQYGLVVFLAKITQLGTLFWDKIILIAHAAVFLPLIIYQCLVHYADKFQFNNNIYYLSTLTILMLPYPFLIATTPQGMANLLTLILACLGLAYLKNRAPLWLLWLIAAAIAANHALAGLPALLFCGFLTVKNLPAKFKHPLNVALVLFGAISVPLAFIVNAKLTGAPLSIKITELYTHWPSVSHIYLHYPLRDLIYFYAGNIEIVAGVLALGAMIYFIIKKFESIWWFYIITIILILVNYLLISNFLYFENIIKYERNDFANRLLQIALLFMYPALIILNTFFVQRIINRGFWSLKLLMLMLGAGLMAAATYISYPRWDQYAANHGYNTSIYDFQAVDTIQQLNHDNDNYAVLAPQTASAAALTRFGFNHYHNGHYFYPIPTGGQLYQYYLAMVEQPPEQRIIDQAMELTNTSRLYLVIPEYWRDSAARIDQAQQIANNRYTIANGQITILEFVK